MAYIDQLKALRAKASLRIAQVVRKADASSDTIARTERQHNTPYETLVNVVRALNMLYYVMDRRTLLDAAKLAAETSQYKFFQMNSKNISLARLFAAKFADRS